MAVDDTAGDDTASDDTASDDTAGKGGGSTDTNIGRPFPPTDPDCELCQADRFTHWYAVTDHGWVADCEVCSVPMVVWWDHGPEAPEEIRSGLLAALATAADARFGADNWELDTTMRQVPQHFHAHARDHDWWRLRMTRALSRYTGVGSTRQTTGLGDE